jgi:DNA-binding transcriptional regulator LsrR (DeoR family)
VALAAGAEKSRAVLAVARAGVVDVLVIDAPLARSLQAAAGA